MTREKTSRKLPNVKSPASDKKMEQMFKEVEENLKNAGSVYLTPFRIFTLKHLKRIPVKKIPAAKVIFGITFD